MKLFLITIIQVFLYVTVVEAQYAELLHKPYADQKEILLGLYYSANHDEISLPALGDTLAGMRELGIREQDQNLVMEADLLEAFYNVYNRLEGVEALIRVQKESEGKGFMYIASRAANAISAVYWEGQEFEKSIRWHLLLDDLISSMEINDFPDKAVYLQEIGDDFLFFGDYQRAITYFKRVVDLPIDEYYIYAYRHSLNNLGLSYRELGKIDSSDYAFDLLLAHADSTSEQWVGIASGNLGYNHYLRGEFEAAIPLFERDIALAERYEDYGLAAGSCIPLADIYVQTNKLTLAKSYLDKAMEYILLTHQTDRFVNLYPVMSKWESEMNHPGKATAYLDSALSSQKQLNEKFNALQLMRANQEVMASQNEKAIQELNDEASRNKLIRTFILAGLGVVLIGFIAVYQIQNERIKAERKLKAKELDQAQLELENAQNLLETYKRKINTNSKIIQTLEDSAIPEEEKKVLQELKASTILTETDWKTFQVQFQKVFPDLLDNLIEKYPNLSPAEIRFLLLTKLEMSTAEIANALGISSASLRVTWYRIRKKLDLPKDFHSSLFFEKHFY